MELVIHPINHRQSNHSPIVIAPVGDIQWQGPGGPTAKDTLKRHIDAAMQQNAWFLGMGDYIDFLSPSNRTRLAGAALYDSAMDVIDDKAMDLVHELYQNFLKPTRGRWLGMLEGHHYHTLKTGETTDMRLCQLLDAPFLGTCAKINLRIRMGQPSDAGTQCNVTLWAHHGVGNGQTPAAALNKLKQEAAHHEGVDVFLMGHTCLTTRARILTRHGLKSHDEVRRGEDVLAYDIGSSSCRWTPLLDVTTYPMAPLLRLTSKSFRAEMTPDHQWVMRNHRGDERLRTVEDAKSYERIIVAAAACSGDSALSSREAAILGWLVTDGCVRHATKTGRTRSWLDCRVAQTKPQYIRELRALLGRDASEYKRSDGGTEFYLRAPFARGLFQRAGYEAKHDLPRIATTLSQRARRAMFDAFLKAEGNGVTTFSQAPGPVWDAFLVLAALEGIRLGVRCAAYDHTVPRFIKARQIVAHGPVWRAKVLTRHQGPPVVGAMTVAPHGVGPVWCPTTAYGTWVAELDGQTFITGNTKAPVDRFPKLYTRWNDRSGAVELHRDVHLVSTGGFSLSRMQGARQGQVARGGYAEQKMLPPSSIGAPFVLIYLKRTSRGTTKRHRTITNDIKVVV